MVTLIGDAHGKMSKLGKILFNLPPGELAIQLGDMGCGFVHVPDFGPNFKFIRGNHDDPTIARAHINYLGEYGTLYRDEGKIFYLGGAYSVDQAWRIPDVSWWRDEQLSILELNIAINLYERYKPKIVISHEAPSVAVRTILSQLSMGRSQMKEPCIRTRTAQALQSMFEIHKPKMWFFGHYHITTRFEIEGTTFQCLDELATAKISLDNDLETVIDSVSVKGN